jgi:DUF1680 family protein
MFSALLLLFFQTPVQPHPEPVNFSQVRMKTVWSDVVERNMYITGGIGSSGNNEGFSTDYDLPNEQAYCETCASVGMVFWNQRMNALTDVWVNLFVGSNTTIPIKGNNVSFQLQTKYPWDGHVTLISSPVKKTNYALHLRIPGWARGIASPGGLYQFADGEVLPFTITVNGRPAGYRLEKGYAVIDRDWKKGDKVELTLPMDIRRVGAAQLVKADHDRIALQRGPLIYCVEGADNEGQAWNILLPDQAVFTVEPRTVLTEPVLALQGKLPVVMASADGYNVRTEQRLVTAIPYYTWCNRGNNAMQVWLPRKISDIKINY